MFRWCLGCLGECCVVLGCIGGAALLWSAWQHDVFRLLMRQVAGVTVSMQLEAALAYSLLTVIVVGMVRLMRGPHP